MSKTALSHNFRVISEKDQVSRTLKNKSNGITSQEMSPLVAPGEYRMVYVTRFTAYIRNQPKLAIRFRIIDQGEFFGVELERWYNCKRLIGKPGKNGGFMPKRHGVFLHEYCTLFPSELTRHSRLDRISFKSVTNSVITGRIETVTKNAEQRDIPIPLQYSVIRELIKAGA